jgi:TRAP-type mannitol/chloroaromatic compound transport system permease small subunit
MWTGKTFAWCILILTLAVSYEVFVRYVLRAPTSWAYDLSYTMYGALFIMAGPYALSRDGHVRGDSFYRHWRPRTQAAMDLALYFLFFFPGVLALFYAGFRFAQMSYSFGETSVYSPAGFPIWQLKALIPIAGFLLLLQGVAEVIRCVRCLREGAWPERYKDVEEMESALQHFEEDHKAIEEAHARRPGDRP